MLKKAENSLGVLKTPPHPPRGQSLVRTLVANRVRSVMSSLPHCFLSQARAICHLSCVLYVTSFSRRLKGIFHASWQAFFAQVGKHFLRKLTLNLLCHGPKNFASCSGGGGGGLAGWYSLAMEPCPCKAKLYTSYRARVCVTLCYTLCYIF